MQRQRMRTSDEGFEAAMTGDEEGEGEESQPVTTEHDKQEGRRGREGRSQVSYADGRFRRMHKHDIFFFPGLSSASLEVTDEGDGFRGLFSGKLSLDVMEGSRWNISRSGFCGMRSKKFDGFIDLDSYDSIALKLKGDGRCYISTIPLARYLPTWRGNVIDASLEMNPARVLGMSLSVNAEGGVPGAKSGPGDFRVEIDWIKAVRTE
ncbi:putative complex I intermediate-associated protein 30 [Bienertia sinuspersici]